MRNSYLILFSVAVVFFLSFIIYDEITGKVVVSEEFDFTCIYRHKQGTNELPLETCCRRIKGFFRCEEFGEEIEISYDGFTRFVSRYCYNNREGELGVFFGEEVWNYCKDEGYI